jgi:filamentous hemagglutinin family protein
MATAAVVALMGLPTGPARAQEPGAALQDGGASAPAGGAVRPHGEDVARAPHASNGTARLPRGESAVREPRSAALPRIARDALPRNPNVVAGGATFAEDGSRLDIDQATDRVVIDWRSFDIGQDAEVNFHQPVASSIAVNRISRGGVPSQIQGVLRANGAVVILNPNGVIFSATSRVDVGGLIASTGSMDVSRFMAGSNRLDFTGATAGEIVMGGAINIADAGLAAFVAPHVRNDGVINARLGRVALASGETFTLDLAGDRLIELGLGAHSPLVENFGSILVDGGRVQLSAAAAGAVVDQVINAGGLISVASARAEGGAIVLEGANGGVTVSGELNASGATGGGDITVSGATVRTTPNAVMRADATGAGDGGSIVSIAQRAGTYAGTLSARGGAAGGDGGFVETSGKTVSLDAGLRVDTTAAEGVNGSWSIDPEDLVIGSGEAAAVVASLSTTNVVLQAQNSITIDSLINSSAQSNANTLSLNDEGGAAGLTANLNAAIRLGANQRLLGQATQVNVRNGGVIQNAVDVAVANAGIVIGAGDYVGGTIINKNGLTLTGQAGARIVMPETPELNGVTINADNVTVQGLEIVGPATGQSYLTYGWSGITRGIFAMNGADNFTIANNNIHGVRTGVLVDGRNAGGSITGNIIDSTKSGVSVQYTDAGLLNAEGFAVNIADNSEGPFGNEWGFNFHLNGHQTPGGLVGNAVKIAPTASTAVQQALLAVAAANGGMSAQDQGYSFANRTAVWVGTAGNDANRGSRLAQLASIQAGVDAVVTGGKVNVGAGTFVQPTGSPAYLWVNRSVEIAGAGQGLTIIDARAASTYGIRVQADNVNLHDFTLWGVAAAGNTYGIKVEPLQTGPNNPNARLLNFTLANVTIQGSGKTELDLNGVVGATLANVTANGMVVGGTAITAGNGVSITDSANITLTGVTTLNNRWGGLALYQTNRSFNQQLDNISVGASNTFNEANGLYLEDESDGGAGSVVGGVGLDAGALDIAGYDYIVSDRSNPADVYTWFRRDEADAFDWLGLTGRAATGFIEGWTGTAGNNVFSVGVVGSTAMSINSAISAARSGGTINVGAGTYADTVRISRGVTLAGAGIGQTNLTGGILMSGAFGDLTLKGFTVTGDAGGNFVVQGGQVTNLTVDGVRIDAQGVAGRHGFGSGQYGGAISITHSQFANIDGWVVFDTRSGAGAGGGTQIASGVFSNNTIDNSHGNVNFRQQTGAFAYPDIVIADNTVTNVGSSSNSFGAVFKVFNAGTVDFTGNSVSGVGTSGFNPAGEAPYGAVLMTRGVNQLNIVGNTFANNNQVLAIEPGRGLSTNTFLAGNTFTNNRYGIYMPNNAVAGGAVTFGAGNDFIAGADTVQHIVWRSASGLDLTNVAFNGKLGSAMSLGELFDVEDLISHGTDVAGRGLARVKAGEIFVTTGSGSVQRGVDVAAQGDTVHVDAGTYALPGELRITKSLSLLGAGAGGTIFNSASTGYGVFVAADDVTLGGFTFNGNPAGSYGVKVQPNSADPGARLRRFAIADVAINGTRRTGLDLNGVVGAVIDGVTVTGAIAGNGVSITDSADVMVRNTTTSGNAWGGLALYQANRFFDQQVGDIVVEAGNVFGEVRGLYTQDESALFDFGGLTLSGFDFTVRNDDFQPDAAGYTFYMTTLQGALDYGVVLGAAGSYVQGWNGTQGDAHYYVGGGDAGAGRRYLSIQTAFDKSSAGSVIDIFSGDYTGVATLTGQRDLRFGVVTLGGLDLTSGASGTVLSGDITATGGLDFDGGIVLGGHTRLAAGGDISLIGVDGHQSLSVEGQGLVHVGQVGASVALASLSVVGSDVTVRGATTTGDQSFAGDAVLLWGGFDAGGDFTVDGSTTLGGDSVVDSDGDIRLGSIDGAYNLSLNAGGDVDLGAIGAVEALNGLNVLGAAITSQGATTEAGQSWNAAAVGLSGAYAAGGDITVNGAARLNGSTSLTSDDYVALGSVDGAHDLTVQAANFAVLGPVGGTTALVDLVVGAGQITAAGARTTGSQAFSGARVGLSGAFIAGGGFTVDGAMDLNGDVEIEGDDVTLASVDGGHDLTVDADGAVTLGALGSTTAVGSLDISGASIASQGAATTGGQTFQAASVALSGAYAAGGDFTVDGAADLTDDVAIDGDDVALASVDGAHDLAIDAGGAVSLGAVGSTTALASLDVAGASIASQGAITTGAQAFTGASVGLSGDYRSGGDFTVDGETHLTGDTSIEGDAVTLASVDGAHDLAIDADGAVSLGAVGSTAALAALDVSGASIASQGAATTGRQTFQAASVGLSGGYTAGGDFTVDGATSLNGDVAVEGDDVILASVDGAHDLTIDAEGAVTLGAVGSTMALASLDVAGASIASQGAFASGDQAWRAATVGLSGAYAAGGDLVVDGAAVLTGDAGLDAGGNVVLGTVNGAHSLSIGSAGSAILGAVGGSTALTNLDVTAAAIVSDGAVTTGDQSYDAATIGLSGLYAAGGDFVVDGAANLNGAASIEADAVAMGTVDGARHLSIAADGAVGLGAIGATTALTGLDVSGASIVARGARTIGGQSWTGQAIRLAGGFATDNGDFGLIGLTTLDGATTIATSGGDVVAETIDGAGAGGQSLSIDAGAGAVSVGSMGAGGRLGAVLVRSSGTVLNGATYAGSSLAFLGSGAGSTVRLTQASTSFDTAPTGSAAGGIVVQPDLIGTVNGAQSVVFNAGSGLGADNGDVTLANAGSQALRLGSMTVTGGDFSARTVKLAGDFTSVLSGDQVFSANTLDTLANVNTTVGGDDSGPVIAGGAVTLATAGSSTGSIAAGGPVSVVAGGAVNQNIASTGAVAVTSTGASVTGAIQGGGVAVTAQGAVNTNVTATGAVAVTSTGGAVNGAIQGGAGVSIAAQGPITANVSTPGVVTVTSPQPVTVVVNAGSVVVNAPGGKVDGTFGSIATDPNGTIDVNGQTVIGAGSTDARQILIDQFLAPVGGVVGAGGQIRLPVNLAVALIPPAGQGDRRPIVVNSIDRLGELLRLGYTAIIVQLDSGAAYEQEIDLAAATEARPAG